LNNFQWESAFLLLGSIILCSAEKMGKMLTVEQAIQRSGEVPFTECVQADAFICTPALSRRIGLDGLPSLLLHGLGRIFFCVCLCVSVSTPI